MLLARFRGADVPVEELTDFVLSETPFLRTHFKTQILKPMEATGELSVLQAKAGRKRGTFPDGTVIRLR